jgi:phosphate transport system permease protein
MSEANTHQNNSQMFHSAASDAHERWRLLKDKIVSNSIIGGGLSIIAAVVLIFFYLLYVVLPMLLPSSAEIMGRYAVPEVEQGSTVLLSMEEQNEVGVRFTDKGKAVFFGVEHGQTLQIDNLPIPEGVSITSYAHGGVETGLVAFGLSDGRVVVARHEYKQTYPEGKRVITPSIQYPLGNEPVVIDSKGRALTEMAIKVTEKASTIIAKTVDDQLLLLNLRKKVSMFDDEVTWERNESTITDVLHDVDFMLIDKDQRNLYVASHKGQLSAIDIVDKEKPISRKVLTVMESGAEITSFEFLNGDVSLLIGDSKGDMAQWSLVKDKQGQATLQKYRSFKVSDKAVITINPEQRRKGMLAADSDGTIGIYHSTAERELIKEQVQGGKPVATTLSPRADALLIQTVDGQINHWDVDNEHPEISVTALWKKVWYESYSEPKYIWQSSSASNDFEPKLSMVPLVFGTLKASFYAMLVAIPLALFGAIYTGYFMSPNIRTIVKPGIEIMGALPSVILGFLAGLWLAPFIEMHLLGIFSLLMIVPLGVMIFAYAWQFVPEEKRQRIPEGWDAIILVPVILISAWLAFEISPGIEATFFGGSLRTWMNSEFGIGYDQRNTLVVGFAMGFAVIPMVFSIAEDAIFSVPKHLTTGSLALGATPWQTLTKVVILTASPGIFSAIMIGLGRAVGETMIVLMATGNTPVMDISIFQGLRTLAANIAVEMPESEVNSTHYRILFLSALVLFLFTFVVNTLAEVIRNNLRQKYSSL